MLLRISMDEPNVMASIDGKEFHKDYRGHGEVKSVGFFLQNMNIWTKPQTKIESKNTKGKQKTKQCNNHNIILYKQTLNTAI